MQILLNYENFVIINDNINVNIIFIIKMIIREEHFMLIRMNGCMNRALRYDVKFDLTW